MRFSDTAIAGVRIVEMDRLEDERGFFARAWCGREFAEAGLDSDIAQVNISFNHRAGTVRGLHFQAAPREEGKVVRCTLGAIFDVAVDLRSGSATHGQWVGVELSAENRRGLFIPKGCAHGFQSLTDDTEVLYLMSEYFDPDAGRGVRYDDPDIGIRWPLEVTVVSEKDRGLPTLMELQKSPASGIGAKSQKR
jgi:dTDP-4-dehydrorhamnose 3,5-epimerase